MIKITNIKKVIEKPLTKEDISKHTKIPQKDILNFQIALKSVDARKKPDIYYDYSVIAKVKNEKKYLSNKNVSVYKENLFDYVRAKNIPKKQPLVVGLGPAGLFSALYLSKSGIKPIVIERGESVDKRTEAVENFWKTGKLLPNSNVQFGEGGAGTFSDGKLTTGVNDERMLFIKEQFVAFGAPFEILYQKKAHIGTDKLRITVKNIRNELIKLGADVRFKTTLKDIEICDGKVVGAVVESDGKTEKIDTDTIILATGHSARDTFKMLKEKNVPMERKTFSIGGRIEHLQKDIGYSQYGEKYKMLPPADYKLSVNCEDGRGVYTFCMCPGGYVVGAASEQESVVTNGMSYFCRDGENANSALLVTVNPEDIEGDDVLGGVYLQEEIEKKAYLVGGNNYFAPVQLVGDFLEDKKSEKFYEIIPTYKPGTTFCEIKEVLPPFIIKAMREAIVLMDKKMRGFNNPHAVITVPETRSSSPVRILRSRETFESSVLGLYPCGEGAGYAGGIMSAAADGIKCAEAIIKSCEQ